MLVAEIFATFREWLLVVTRKRQAQVLTAIQKIDVHFMLRDILSSRQPDRRGCGSERMSSRDRLSRIDQCSNS